MSFVLVARILIVFVLRNYQSKNLIRSNSRFWYLYYFLIYGDLDKRVIVLIGAILNSIV
jgi:hypothetical protein